MPSEHSITAWLPPPSHEYEILLSDKEVAAWFPEPFGWGALIGFESTPVKGGRCSLVTQGGLTISRWQLAKPDLHQPPIGTNRNRLRPI
jgi:hypothetical protein